MLLWIAATAVAFFVKGLCGFANTLVFTSILAFGTPNAGISPIELLLGYPTNLILAWRNRSRLRRKIVVPMTLLVLAGSVPGAFLLKNTDSGLIRTVFGAVAVLAGVDMLLRSPDRPRAKGRKLVLGIIGVLSGLLCGLFGAGVLLAAYVGRTTDTGDEFKANICAVFAAENTFRIVLYSLIGIITPGGVKQAALLAPVMLAGLYAGIKSAGALDDGTVKRLVTVLLILSGIAMIVMNIR